MAITRVTLAATYVNKLHARLSENCQVCGPNSNNLLIQQAWCANTNLSSNGDSEILIRMKFYEYIHICMYWFSLFITKCGHLIVVEDFRLFMGGKQCLRQEVT